MQALPGFVGLPGDPDELWINVLDPQVRRQLSVLRRLERCSERRKEALLTVGFGILAAAGVGGTLLLILRMENIHNSERLALGAATVISIAVFLFATRPWVRITKKKDASYKALVALQSTGAVVPVKSVIYRTFINALTSVFAHKSDGHLIAPSLQNVAPELLAAHFVPYIATCVQLEASGYGKSGMVAYAQQSACALYVDFVSGKTAH